jgi:hypothetical protein
MPCGSLVPGAVWNSYGAPPPLSSGRNVYDVPTTPIGIGAEMMPHADALARISTSVTKESARLTRQRGEVSELA